MKNAFEIKLHSGDMVFFNNLGMLHARDRFIDNEATRRKRHLLRLIVRNEEVAYELPQQLKEVWRTLYEHDVEDEILPVQKTLFTRAASH